MSNTITVFSDTVLVRDNSDSVEYCQLRFAKVDELQPYEVTFSRHTVPGRVDLYHFGLIVLPQASIGRVSFFSDQLDLREATRDYLAHDLRRVRVVRMLNNACVQIHAFYVQRLYSLLSRLDVNSPACQAVSKMARSRKSR